MSALTEIRRAFDVALADIPEPTEVSLIGGKYDEGTDRFMIRVLVGRPSPEATDRLDELLGRAEGSVCAHLEVAPTLGGTVGALNVRTHSGHRIFRSHEGAAPELGSDVVVEVHRLPER